MRIALFKNVELNFTLLLDDGNLPMMLQRQAE